MTRFIKTRATKKKDSLQSIVNCKPKSNKKIEPNNAANRIMCCYYNCKKDAVGVYTVNPDRHSLTYCEKHKKEIGAAILWRIIGIEELFLKSIGFPEKRNIIRNKDKEDSLSKKKRRKAR